MPDKIQLIFLLLAIFCFVKIEAQYCGQYAKCGECMSDPSCQWCSDVDYEGKRCTSLNNLNNLNNFEYEDDVSLESDSIICKNQVSLTSDFQVIDDENLDNEILVKPQKVHLDLRPGLSQEISFTIGKSQDYPVDLYILCDLSASMRYARNYLAEQVGAIIGSITKITKDLKIGFGSFVDKDLAPFKSTSPEFNKCPENPKGINCTDAYSFYHRIPIGNHDEKEFEKLVKEVPLAGNVDNPEGSLDALLQVMTCTDRIGWRKSSRKIILLATDGDYHNALDGKLVGILHPNDGNCHLGQDGYHTKSKYLDYPSVSQINYVAKQSSFLIIFAPTALYKGVYDALKEEIYDSSVAVLEPGGANIVNIIETTYKKFVGTVQVQAQNLPKEIDVSFKSKCADDFVSETSACKNIPYGESVDFTASITLDRCVNKSVQFEISPIGIGQKLEIFIDSSCQCPCEDPNANAGFSSNDVNCLNRGNLTCGICSCYDDFTGPNCECDKKSFLNSEDPDSKCKDSDSENPDVICNGRGTCQCGQCLCDEGGPDLARFYGQFCECDDLSCLRGPSNDLLCSGNGNCQCGLCKCNVNWKGEDCGCSKSTDQCIWPYNQEICSGNGNCACNKCQCDTDTDGGLFSGRYCELYPNEVKPCKVLAPKVECQAFGTGELNECQNQDVVFEYLEIDDSDPMLVKENACEAINANGCKFRFTPVTNDLEKLFIYIHINADGQKEKCPTSPVLTLSLSLGAAILLLGALSILFFKCYIVVTDRREYARFIQERDNFKAAINENPLHISPITKFENPMYEKKQD